MFRDDPGEKLAFFRPPCVSGVEIMAAWNSGEPWHVYHEQYAICACATAATGIRYRGRIDPIGDRSVCFFEPGEAHRNTKVHKRSDFRVLFITQETFDNAMRESGVEASAHFDLIPKLGPESFPWVYAFCAAVESGASTLEQETRFAACMNHLMACAERPPPVPKVAPGAMERVKRYLVERYSEPVTLAELAGIARMSRFHLVRAFARHFGLAPHAFQVHVRVARARTLLREGWLPAQVASAVGFADQSHLTRHFRRIWGITPKAYSTLAALSAISF